MEYRDDGQVHRIPGGRLKGADAPLTENDLAVASGHDILRAHKQLLQRVAQPPLQQHRLAQFAQLLEQFKVLHVPRPNLDDVDILKQRQMLGVHDLCDNGQTRDLLGLQQQTDALLMESLEGVGGGAGLECAAPQGLGARRLDALGNGDDLLLLFHRTGSGHHQKMTAADLGSVAEGDDRVLLVELAVGILIRLLDSPDHLHNVQRQNALHVHPRGVADQADDGVVLAYGHVGLQTHVAQPAGEQLHLLGFRVLLQNDDHYASLLLMKFDEKIKKPYSAVSL